MNCHKQRGREGIEPKGGSIIKPYSMLHKKDSHSPTSEQVDVDGNTFSVPGAAKKEQKKPILNENVPLSKKELPQQKVPKQQSSFFRLGLSTGRSRPTSPESSESTTGKLFGFAGLTETARSRSPSPQSMTNVSGKFLGFGSTIISSASNLISSAVQDESSPPISRKGSTVSQSSTPPTSRKGSIAPTGEPKSPISKTLRDKPIEKKTEKPYVTKAKSTVTEKQDSMPESVTVLPKSPSETSQPTCPLCKVELNVGSEELSNYNTCTECKDMVCNLCGFNPMPHLDEVSHFSSLFLQSCFQNY